MDSRRPEPRRFALVGGLALVVAAAFAVVGGVGVAAARDRAAGPPPVAAATSQFAEVASTIASTTSVPAVAPPPTTVLLPQPEDAPADAYADVPLVDIGTIRIPKIGLEHTVYEGVWLTVIDRGPGHWPGSAMPGEVGNAVFGGHRVTHSRPFRHLDSLVAGDEIVFERPGAAPVTYRVDEVFVVQPEDTWIVNQSPASTVTLFACHPVGSAAQRIVVKGTLASA